MGKHTYDDFEVVKKSVAYISEHLESQIGALDKMVVIFSRIDAERKNSDLGWVKEIGSMLQHNYPERLEIAHVAPVSLFFWGLWKVAQFFFDPKTRSKID